MDAFHKMPVAGLFSMVGWDHGHQVQARTKSLNRILEEDAGIAPLEEVEGTQEAAGHNGASTPSDGLRKRRGSAKDSRRRSRSRSSSPRKTRTSRQPSEIVPLPDDVPPLNPQRKFAVNLLVIDVEGLEWPILQSFDIDAFRPEVVIVEIQEKLSRYHESTRALEHASALTRRFFCLLKISVGVT